MTTTVTDQPPAPQRAEYIKGLRALADLLDAHPELSLPHEGVLGGSASIFVNNEKPLEQALTFVQAMSEPPTVEFNTVDVYTGPTTWVDIEGRIAGYHLAVQLRAHEVCEKSADGEWVMPAELRKAARRAGHGVHA